MDEEIKKMYLNLEDSQSILSKTLDQNTDSIVYLTTIIGKLTKRIEALEEENEEERVAELDKWWEK